MNKFILYIAILLWSQNIISQQLDIDSLNFNYHTYKENLILKDCDWYNKKDFSADINTIRCLNIANNKKLDYFLNHLSDFKHIKALSIHKVKIKNFKFMKHLPNLEYISVGILM